MANDCILALGVSQRENWGFVAIKSMEMGVAMGFTFLSAHTKTRDASVVVKDDYPHKEKLWCETEGEIPCVTPYCCVTETESREAAVAALEANGWEIITAHTAKKRFPFGRGWWIDGTGEYVDR